MSATLSNNLGLITLICSTWSSTLSTHLVSSTQSYQLNLTNNLFIIILICSSYFDPLDMRNMIWSAWSYQLICYYKTLPNLFDQLDLLIYWTWTYQLNSPKRIWCGIIWFVNLVKLDLFKLINAWWRFWFQAFFRINKDCSTVLFITYIITILDVDNHHIWNLCCIYLNIVAAMGYITTLSIITCEIFFLTGTAFSIAYRIRFTTWRSF